MRSKASQQLNAYRKRHPTLGLTARDAMYGYFECKPFGGLLRIISSGEYHGPMTWEHVSVSLADRCPTWDEMSFVKDLFWLPTELVVQFHPPKSKHINFHPYCLHLWRDESQTIQLPPDWTIARKLTK